MTKIKLRNMIDYISGKIADLTPTRVVIDNNGIGYGIEISLQTYAELDGLLEAKVLVQQQVNQRDGTTVDYGFATVAERDLFQLITGVSGMGASTARMILSTFTSEELKEAIIAEDINKIKSVKGLGLKSAQRLILELKDKLVKGEDADAGALLRAEINPAAEEATTALQLLGFSKPNIAKALQAVLKNNPSAKVEELIKAALQIL